MRTKLNINDEALAAAKEHATADTKAEVVNEALGQFARTKRRKVLLNLRDKVRWEGDIDKLRERK